MENHLRGSTLLFGTTKVIMVAVDGSEGSDRAAHISYELAEITKSKILITHIINIGTIQHLAKMSDKETLEILNHYRDNADKLLERHRVDASEYNLEVELILDKGLPSDKIVHLAKDNEADIIVMGYYGATGSKAGFGSSTERVVRNSHCPVLVVK